MKRLSVVVCLLLTFANPLLAHEGHDHDAAKAEPNLGNTPQRQPDGSVFLPKSAQRQMGVLTAQINKQDLPRVVELPGKVVMDPHLGGRVQAMIPGRLEAAGVHGLPSAGSRAKKGDVLAWVVPSAGQIERSNQNALLAELKSSRQLAEKRLSRLRELADTVPKKEIEAAESEVASLSGRMAAVGSGLNNREALIAPVSGVIAASNAVIGQVVEPRELIFELVDPDSLHIEAMAYEVLQPDQVAAATLAAGERSVSLSFIGASRRLREQSLPLMFENHAAGAGLALPLGMPVKVQVQLKAQISGLPVPMTALSRSQANEVMVWVKLSPERFVPRAVQTTPFDGLRVIVTQGLVAGDRVVVQGANLISQIR
jgi:hypothetical protein